MAIRLKTGPNEKTSLVSRASKKGLMSKKSSRRQTCVDYTHATQLHLSQTKSFRTRRNFIEHRTGYRPGNQRDISCQAKYLVQYKYKSLFFGGSFCF